ncbi:MAG: inositol 2-dehydrogenase [Chloroflexota bacterium]|nr:inositol 2-dehydrogenase [Chloroflexota bacterium]
MPADQINIALIGAGRIGRLHAENLAFRIPEANLAAVADIFQEAAQRAADAFRIPLAVEDYHDLLKRDDIDAVIVCSATDTHAQIVEEAAAAGKHVFCEKPIDHDLKKIDQALVAVTAAGVKLQVGFNRRFDPNFKRVHDLVAEGRIGEPRLLHITSHDPEPPPIDYIKVSGGIFLDMTIHDFDMARYLMGCEVEEVFVAGGIMVDPAIGAAGDVDTTLTVLRFENGAIGTIANCREARYGYDQRVELLGSLGNVSASNNYPNSVTVMDANAVQRSKPLYFFLERYAESFLLEMRDFVDAVLTDRQPLVTGTDGRMPVVMGLAAWQSYRENRPVKLSEVG